MTTEPTQTVQEIEINKAVKAVEAATKQLEAQVESLETKAQADSNKQGVTVNTGK